MDSTSKIPDGPGLFVVSQGAGNEQADIVFIHGLGGHPYKTWTSSGDIFWPRDLLGSDIHIPNVRIMTFGYDASPTMVFAGTDTDAVERVASNLLMDLSKGRASEPACKRPIVFIVHSLGGLILEKALVMSYNSLAAEMNAVITNTIMIIFMGTPHIGSNLASWAIVLDRMIQAVTRSKNLAPVPIKDLRNMASVQSEFHYILRGALLKKLHIVCVYEEWPEGIPARSVVPRGDAVLLAYPSFGINSSHMSMTKFKDRMDDGYQLLIDRLRSELIRNEERFPTIVNTSTESAPPNPQEPLTRATTVADDQLEEGEKQLAAKAAQLVEQGQLEKAEELLRLLLDRRLLVSGDDNLANIKLLGTLSSIMWQQGRWPQAETIQRANVEQTKRLLGQNHPDTLIAKQNLASTWVDMGLIEDARDLQREVLSTSMECFTDDDSRTTNARSNLAVILTRAQQFEEAEALLQQVIMSRQKALGLEHIDTVTAGSNLASLYNKMGRFQEAKELQTRQVRILEKTHGSDHPDTLTALDSLASAMSGLGELEEAYEIFTSVLDARRRVLGPENPLVYESTESLAANYTERGYFDAAIELQRQVFDGILGTLGDKSLVAARSGSTLSLIMSKNGQYSEAESNQKTIVDRLKAVYGESDPNTLRAEKILQTIRSERMSATAKHRASSQLPSSKTTTSDTAGEASSPEMHESTEAAGSWAWRAYPAYRLSTAALDKFLVRIFGRFDFFISLHGDSFRFWISRDLTRDECDELDASRDEIWRS